MIVKCINSILTVLVIVLFWVHSICCTMLLLGLIPFTPVAGISGQILLVLIVLHGLLSIVISCLQRIKKTKFYVKLNLLSVVQLVLGVLILVLLFFHQTAYGYTGPAGNYIVAAPTLAIFILELLLLFCAGIHTYLSIPNIFINFGLIKTEKGIIKCRILSAVLTGIPVLLSLAGLAAYFLVPLLGGA